MFIFRFSLIFNGLLIVIVSCLVFIGIYFLVYGENIDYVIRIVEYFMYLFFGGKFLFFFVFYLG